jgi:hypothetical protein
MWSMMVVTFICSLVPWFIFYKRMVPLVNDAKQKPIKYDQGIVYHF